MLDIRNLGLRSLKEVNIQEDIIELYCSHNKIETLEGLEKYVNLTELYCGKNKIKSLEGIEKCINLTYLDCGRNELETLEGIEKCINLTKLDCSNNKIKSLEGIDKCVNLTELYCSNNKLKKLKYCPESIRDIKYDENPIKEEYRGSEIGEIHNINKEKWERSIYREVMKEDNFL